MRPTFCPVLLPLLALACHAALAQPAALGANGVTTVLVCQGGAARIHGYGNQVTVAGHCTNIDVRGSDNIVTADVDPGALVRVDGDRNRIIYAGPVAPQAITNGFYDQVVRAEQPPSMLVLDPGSPSFDVVCTNRDVLIRGDSQRYVLRGGCRSLTVEGRLDAITAELQPGAQVAIGGAGVILNYVLVAEGPAPVVRVTVPGLKAEQIQHYDNSQLSLRTYR